MYIIQVQNYYFSHEALVSRSFWCKQLFSLCYGIGTFLFQNSQILLVFVEIPPTEIANVSWSQPTSKKTGKCLLDHFGELSKIAVKNK